MSPFECSVSSKAMHIIFTPTPGAVSINRRGPVIGTVLGAENRAVSKRLLQLLLLYDKLLQT